MKLYEEQKLPVSLDNKFYGKSQPPYIIQKRNKETRRYNSQLNYPEKEDIYQFA